MAEEFISGTRPPDAGFATQLVQPPSALYIAPEENVVLGMMANANGLTITYNIRLLLADGTVQFITHSVTSVNAGFLEVFPFPLAEGFLLSVQAYHGGNIAMRGGLYAFAYLSRGSADGLNTIETIIADYVTTSFWPTWPMNQPASPDGGFGEPVVLELANPAAGAELIFNATLGKRYRIKAIGFTFTASAAVANRTVRLQLTGATNSVVIAADTTVIAASQVMLLAFSAFGSAAYVAGAVHMVPMLPDLVISEETMLSTSTANIQAADQISAVAIHCERWL